MAVTKASIKSLKPGRFCVIENEPCRVLSISISVSGKHGSAKARLEAVGLFDGKKRSIVRPADAEIEVPIVDKRNGQVVSVVGDTAQVMDLETYETFECSIPEDLKGKLSSGDEVQYWVVLGKKMIVQLR